MTGKQAAQRKGEPATHSSSKDTRAFAWYETGLFRALRVINGLPDDYNVYKPGNEFYRALWRIGGISKAGHIGQDDALDRIKFAARHMRLQGKEIEYQWARAYKRAIAWRGPG